MAVHFMCVLHLLHFGREVQPALFVTDMLLCIFLGGRLMHETVLVVRLVMLDY
jgi:hypothetical protein